MCISPLLPNLGITKILISRCRLSITSVPLHHFSEKSLPCLGSTDLFAFMTLNCKTDVAHQSKFCCPKIRLSFWSHTIVTGPRGQGMQLQDTLHPQRLNSDQIEIGFNSHKVCQAVSLKSLIIRLIKTSPITADVSPSTGDDHAVMDLQSARTARSALHEGRAVLSICSCTSNASTLLMSAFSLESTTDQSRHHKS